MKCLHDVFTLHRQIWLSAGQCWHAYNTDDDAATVDEEYLQTELRDWLNGLDTGDAAIARACLVEWFGPQDATNHAGVNVLRVADLHLPHSVLAD